MVITFPRNEMNYEIYFLSTVQAEGVLFEAWIEFVAEQKEIALAQDQDLSYGTDKMTFKLLFKAEESFYGGIFPDDEDIAETGIGCTNMENSDGSSAGVVLTFAVIEKETIAQKLQTPPRRMPKQRSVRTMRQESSANAQAASTRDAAAARQFAREREILRREQQVNLAEMELMRQRNAQVDRVAGRVRTHNEINDVGNVEMVEEDDDSIL